MASHAELVILDEPTAGLDPLMESVFRDCVLDARRNGRTVLLSSQIMAEVEHVCDRVTIIRKGKVVDSGSLADLRHLACLTVTAQSSASVSGVSDLTPKGEQWAFQVEPASLDSMMSKLGGMGTIAIESHPRTLEELLLRQYGGDLNGQSAYP